MSPSGCSSCLLLFLIQLCVALHYPRSGNVLCNLKGGQCLPSNTSLCNLLDVYCDEGSICCSVATKTNASLTSRQSATCYSGPTDTYGSSGYISVWSSDLYANNLNCWWYISVDAGSTIYISWSLFELEGYYPGCPYDYVSVYDPWLIGTFCGYTSYALTTSSNQFWVNFRSDSSVQRQGFILNYYSYGSSSATCSGTQYTYGPSGSISVWSTSLYENNLDCWWDITVSYWNTIYITWSQFDLEGYAGCPYDYVEIYDSGILLGEFCGDGLPPALTSSTNEVLVHFRTDSSVVGQGFILAYSEF